MSLALVLLPDFSLILLGHLLRRSLGFGEDGWPHLEKLVYFVLFPALLFVSLARGTPPLATAAPLLATGLAFTAAGIALGAAALPLFRMAPGVFASGFQCAFRFNSYIGFAVAGRLHGQAGLATIALLFGVLVPLVNLASVWMLARHGGRQLWRELAGNPLILATLGGIAWGAGGLPLPQFAELALTRLGQAAVPLGLLAVGAGLRLSGWSHATGPLAWWTAVKLAAVPGVAWLASRALGLERLEGDVALTLAALPAASSAYILAVRMGGDGRLVATLVTLTTLLSMFTIPTWLGLAGAP